MNVALNIANPFEIAVGVVILFATAVVDVFFWQGAAHGQDKNENRLEEVNCYSFKANVVLNLCFGFGDHNILLIANVYD